MGHEFAGDIVKVGKAHQDKFKPGMKFTLQPALNYKGTMWMVKLPILCILFPRLFSLRLNERAVSASVAISCVADAINDSMIRIKIVVKFVSRSKKATIKINTA